VSNDGHGNAWVLVICLDGCFAIALLLLLLLLLLLSLCVAADGVSLACVMEYNVLVAWD